MRYPSGSLVNLLSPPSSGHLDLGVRVITDAFLRGVMGRRPERIEVGQPGQGCSKAFLVTLQVTAPTYPLQSCWGRSPSLQHRLETQCLVLQTQGQRPRKEG